MPKGLLISAQIDTLERLLTTDHSCLLSRSFMSEPYCLFAGSISAARRHHIHTLPCDTGTQRLFRVTKANFMNYPQTHFEK